MSTQTDLYSKLQNLYLEGLGIIKEQGLHQLEYLPDIDPEDMTEKQAELLHEMDIQDYFLSSNNVLKEWSYKVLEVLKRLPNGIKYEIEFTSDRPSAFEQNKIIRRVKYLERLILEHKEKMKESKELYRYELRLEDKELRILTDDVNLVLYVFREGATYDIFKKAFSIGELIDNKNNLNEYLRTLINVKYLHQFITINIHSIIINKIGYIKSDELEKLTNNKTIQKNTLTYTDISY